MPNPQCAHPLEDGSQCGGVSVDNSEFCFSHDSNKREQKLEACRKGGQMRKKPPKAPLPLITINDFPDIKAGMETVMELFAERQINANDARLMMENIQQQAKAKWNPGGFI